MSCWCRKTILVVVLALILISIAIRYPLVEHERAQTDSYFIHYLADSVIANGKAEWILHPLSYVGYYPLSYPSGIPFLLAESAMITGLPVELCILIIDMIVATLFCLSVFMLARHFTRRGEYALLATFFAIFGARFVDTSYWDASARAPEVVFIVLTIALLLRVGYAMEKRLFFISIVFLVGCFTIHHLAVVLILFGGAYIISVIVADLLRSRVVLHNSIVPTAIIALSLSAIVLIPLVFIDSFWQVAVRNLSGSSLFSFESTVLTVLLTAASSYIIQVGFILIFSAAYIFSVVRRPTLSYRAAFPIFVIAVFIPLFGETLHVSMILLPFFAILGALWFAERGRRRSHRKKPPIILALLMVSSIIMPVWSIDRWNSETYLSGDTVLVDSQLFNDANYLLHDEDPSFALCNVVPVRTRLEAISRLGFLGSGVNLALNGDITASELEESIRQSSSRFPRNLYIWFEYRNEPATDSYIWHFMIIGMSVFEASSQYENTADYFFKHSRLVVVIDHRWSSQYVDPYAVTAAKLPGELLSNEIAEIDPSSEANMEFSSYKYYDSQLLSFYMVGLPGEPTLLSS